MDPSKVREDARIRRLGPQESRLCLQEHVRKVRECDQHSLITWGGHPQSSRASRWDRNIQVGLRCLFRIPLFIHFWDSACTSQ